MENLIEFLDFETSQRGRQMADNSFSVWYNLNGSTKSFGTTFSNDIKTGKKGVKIGKLGNEICFVFTDEPNAIRIYGNTKKERKNIVFNSKGFCEFMFEDLKNIKEGKNRKVFNLKKINNDIFVINNEIK
tara:strand:+ start:259 stop:648 length:390 start_codon:yes stop_codon:yes gene_type:complete